MSSKNYLNVKNIYKHKYNKKQGLGFDKQATGEPDKPKAMKQLTKEKLIGDNIVEDHAQK